MKRVLEADKIAQVTGGGGGGGGGATVGAWEVSVSFVVVAVMAVPLDWAVPPDAPSPPPRP